ncbi:SRPBCC family protein [Streptomonospora sp. S1-112]|uniref:SRPBCC family protein n=1 Tax=Streptomonospora mangrovi TaxID=2883123 RepID=A0A9X3SJB5_9ACTN|nr:SRPBCC family protein [Streptomonospora mangrovi]MDA0567179.1 SRPBCC family protein [Streptomonospora mangrovi]
MAEQTAGPLTRLREAADRNEGTARLADAVGDYVSAKASSLISGAAGKLGESVTRLAGDGGAAAIATGGAKIAQGKNPASAIASAGATGAKEKVKGMLGRLKGGGGSGPKAINIVETIDVGVPVRTAYNQWTRFPDFGSFAKGVQSVEKTDEVSSNWKAKVFWSSRSWKGSVTEQIQDYRIAWTTEGAKGTNRGVVTFHPLAENLTRVLLVVEYYPKGLFERTGNIWRAQGRRLRLDLKHYRRHVMLMAQADAEELDGWRGEIRDGSVVLGHEDALALEEAGLTDAEWAALAELDEDERAELEELDEDERAELAALSEEERAELADLAEAGGADGSADAAEEDRLDDGAEVDEEAEEDEDREYHDEPEDEFEEEPEEEPEPRDRDREEAVDAEDDVDAEEPGYEDEPVDEDLEEERGARRR